MKRLHNTALADAVAPPFALDPDGVPECPVARFAAMVNSRPIQREHIAELSRRRPTRDHIAIASLSSFHR